MPRVQTHEAIVLKTYDTGDADRFCILLTPAAGRIVVCAKGARKPGSRFGSAMQSFQHLAVDLAEHSSGFYMRSAQCRHAFPRLRSDIDGFLLATQGCDLLLRFLHESESCDTIFSLTLGYLRCLEEESSSRTYAVFLLFLLRELGLLPAFDGSAHDYPLRHYSGSIPRSLLPLLSCGAPLEEAVKTVLSPQDEACLIRLCDALIRENLPSPLRSESVAYSMATDQSPHSHPPLRRS
jgi:DNA repair protein RecO (recombination protein O)